MVDALVKTETKVSGACRWFGLWAAWGSQWLDLDA